MHLLELSVNTGFTTINKTYMKYVAVYSFNSLCIFLIFCILYSLCSVNTDPGAVQYSCGCPSRRELLSSLTILKLWTDVRLHNRTNNFSWVRWDNFSKTFIKFNYGFLKSCNYYKTKTWIFTMWIFYSLPSFFIAPKILFLSGRAHRNYRNVFLNIQYHWRSQSDGFKFFYLNHERNPLFMHLNYQSLFSEL